MTNSNLDGLPMPVISFHFEYLSILLGYSFSLNLTSS